MSPSVTQFLRYFNFWARFSCRTLKENAMLSLETQKEREVQLELKFLNKLLNYRGTDRQFEKPVNL